MAEVLRVSDTTFTLIVVIPLSLAAAVLLGSVAKSIIRERRK